MHVQFILQRNFAERNISDISLSFSHLYPGNRKSSDIAQPSGKAYPISKFHLFYEPILAQDNHTDVIKSIFDKNLQIMYAFEISSYKRLERPE